MIDADGLRARTTIVHRTTAANWRDMASERRREPLFNALAPFLRTDAGTGVSRLDDEQVWILRADDRIAAVTAALADSCGAIVEEDASGWSAVEPFTPRWNQVPGACWLWNARRAARGFVIRSVAMCTERSMEREAGRFGWDVLTPERRVRGMVEAIYLHPVLPRPGGRGRHGIDAGNNLLP